MSAYLPVSLVYLSVCMPVFLSSCVHSCLSICLPVSICLSASLCLSVCLSAYLSVSLSLYLSDYLAACSSVNASILAILPFCLFEYFLACLYTYKLACWPSCLPVFLPACLQVWLPTFLLRAYLPANRFALKRSIPATYILGINILETQYHVFNVELDPMR